MKNGITTLDYGQFLERNRITVNKYLNMVLCFFILTGPAIASGVKGGIFPDIDYKTCIGISVGVAFLASGHFLLTKMIPSSTITCIFALTALDVLLVYMSYSHVSRVPKASFIHWYWAARWVGGRQPVQSFWPL